MFSKRVKTLVYGGGYFHSREPMLVLDGHCRCASGNYGNYGYIDEQGRVFVGGTNEVYRLGSPLPWRDYYHQAREIAGAPWFPIQLQIPSGICVKQLSFAELHSAFLTTCGRVFTFGSNDCGQLGMGQDVEFSMTPTLVPNVEKVEEILCYRRTTLYMDTEGHCFLFGNTPTYRSDSLEHPEHQLWTATPVLPGRKVTQMCAAWKCAWFLVNGKILNFFGEELNFPYLKFIGNERYGQRLKFFNEDDDQNFSGNELKVSQIACGDFMLCFVANDPNIVIRCDFEHGKVAGIRVYPVPSPMKLSVAGDTIFVHTPDGRLYIYNDARSDREGNRGLCDFRRVRKGTKEYRFTKVIDAVPGDHTCVTLEEE